ncbi:MAG: tetratricopeptide repeat protein [Steroidobacteraceae bacterium]|nr:tetratricopeptide repeat protein [Steroidobacteraceae bacterium]
MSTRSVLIGVSVALLLAAVPTDAARKREKTIKDLAERPVVLDTKRQIEAGSERAMDNYRRFLELQNTDPRLRAEALRRLGDLNLEGGEIERMASEVNAIDLQGAEAIKLYGALLQAYPDYPRNDEVLYQLARAYETTGQPDKALATLDQLVARYPGTAQLDEVQFRRGELLFSAKDYPAAESAYAAVIARGSKGAFFEESLYKHGWALFKRGLNEDALPSFMGVVEQVLSDPAKPQGIKPIDKLSRAERELIDDTLRVVSIAFSYLDGAESVGQFLASRDDKRFAHLLYSRLGDLFVEKERYQDGAAAYRAYVAQDPNSEFAPQLAMQAIEAYEKGGFANLVLEGKQDYIERYNFGTAFWQGRDPAQYETITSALNKSLKDVASFYHATAQASKKPADYVEAARWYRTYLQSFPQDAQAAATNLLLAETLFDSGDFVGASAEFERTAYDYPKNDKSAAAAYSSLVAYQRHEATLDAAAKPEWNRRSIDAGIRFANTFPEHPDSGGVLTRSAEQVFALGDLPRAIELAELVLARQPAVDVAKQRIAWTIVGQANFDQGQFAKAEQAYAAARNLASTDDKMRADLTERLATSVYRQAEAKRSGGDDSGAAEDFLRVAALSPDSKIRTTAEYDAAAQFINLKNWTRAIEVLEGIRRTAPQNEYAADITRKLAVAYSEAGRPAQAAAEFEHIAESKSEEFAVRREATMQAADLYEKAGSDARAVAMLERFVANYPTPLAESIEARQRLADFAGKSGNLQRQAALQREIIKADQGAGAERTDRTRLLAARAQLALAQPARDAFRAVRLVAPLQQSLARKRKALEAALEGYRQAASYRVASISTLATFETAELYRTLGRDIMQSERPKKLDAEELEAYDSLLEEQAFPFEEQAIETHGVNIARVGEGLYDEGIRKSYTALAEMSPGRYGKTEMMQDAADRPAAFAAPGAQAVAGRIEAEFARALGLLRAGDHNQAAIEFQLLTQAQPELVAPHFNLGMAQRKAGRYAESAQAFQAAAELAPQSAAVLTELGVALREAGQFVDAKGAYERAIAVDSNYAPAYRNLGTLLDLYLSDPAAALSAFETYQSLTGEDKPVSGWIAELKQRVGRTEVRPPDEAPPTEAGPDADPTEPSTGAAQ